MSEDRLYSVVTRATGLRWDGRVREGLQAHSITCLAQPRYDGFLFQVVPFTSSHLN